MQIASQRDEVLYVVSGRREIIQTPLDIQIALGVPDDIDFSGFRFGR